MNSVMCPFNAASEVQMSFDLTRWNISEKANPADAGASREWASSSEKTRLALVVRAESTICAERPSLHSVSSWRRPKRSCTDSRAYHKRTPVPRAPLQARRERMLFSMT
eukprot:6184958-Pleurochrysis_carterae.AAC.10